MEQTFADFKKEALSRKNQVKEKKNSLKEFKDWILIQHNKLLLIIQ